MFKIIENYSNYLKGKEYFLIFWCLTFLAGIAYSNNILNSKFFTNIFSILFVASFFIIFTSVVCSILLKNKK